MPKWFEDEPKSERGDEFYIRAFWELSSCRQFYIVQGVKGAHTVLGPIPWDKLVEYGERAGLEPDMMNVFSVVIRELDEFYLAENRNSI